MPLPDATRAEIDTYVKRDIPNDLSWYVGQFSFIADALLRERVGRAYYAARYMGKLLEATFATGNERHSFVKFQILQYASIYEAVVVYLLWNRYGDSAEVKKLETHEALTQVSALSKDTQITVDNEQAVVSVWRRKKTPKSSIAFRDKVDCAVALGFIDAAYAEDYKRFYSLRNLAHIESEAERQIEVELENSREAYWRMQPFLERIHAKIAIEDLAKAAISPHTTSS